MKKFLVFFLLLSFVLVGCGKQETDNPPLDPKQPTEQPQINVKDTKTESEYLNDAKTQVSNYFNYTPDKTEYNKITRSETDDLYYYASDGNRYTFPNIDIFKSWFGDYDITQFEQQTKEKLYETSLGGNVFLRPGSLMQTPTDPNIYLVISNGKTNTLSKDLIADIYGENWQETALYEIPNFYFTHYKNTGNINSAKEFSQISQNITINKDKNL